MPHFDVDGNRHNPTGCSRAQRKLVRAHARGIFSHVIPAPCLRHSHTPLVIPTPTHVIPAKAGIPAPVRGNGVPFPFPIAARSKNRRQTRRRRESTQSDRMQQSATKTRARTRARHFPPRHSRPCLRHSHTLSTSFPHPAYVIPTPTHVIPAKAGIPVPAAYWGPIAPICRPRVRHRPTNRTHEETRLRFGTTRDTLIDSVRCRAPRRLANECRTAHPRTMLLKRPCA